MGGVESVVPVPSFPSVPLLPPPVPLFPPLVEEGALEGAVVVEGAVEGAVVVEGAVDLVVAGVVVLLD